MQEKGQDSQANDRRHVYLLRCWQEPYGGWRYTLEAVDGRPLARRGHTRREDLLAYLRTLLPEDASAGSQE